MAAIPPQRRFFLDRSLAAQRAVERTIEPLRQVERLGVAQRTNQVDRARRQVQAPASALDATLRAQRLIANARSVTEGPATEALKAIERSRLASEQPARRLAELFERARFAVEGPSLHARRHYQDLSKLLDGYDFSRIVQRLADADAWVKRAIRESLPVNWRALSLDDAEHVERLVREEGLPLVWVPGPAITAELLKANDRDSAMRVLLANQNEVLRDIDCVLAEVVEPALSELVAVARESVEALRDGHGNAAQALAAAVFTSAIHDGLQHEQFSDLRAEADGRDLDQATFSEYRAALVVQLAARYVQGREWEEPGFNRSSTLHRVKDAPYNPKNNLEAVMAAAGVLREAQARIDEGAAIVA